MNARSFLPPVGALVLAGSLGAGSQRGFAQCCPPTITTQPTNQTVAVGSPVTFSVEATIYSFTTYQWRFNGTNISGASATSSNYLITSVQMTNAGDYSVAITNAAGYIISSNA